MNGGNNNTIQMYDAHNRQKSISFQVFRTDSAFLDIFHIRLLDDRKLSQAKMYFSESTFDSLQLAYDRTPALHDIDARSYMVGGRYADFKFRSVLDPQSPTFLLVEHPDSLWAWNVVVETIDGDLPVYKKELDALYSEIIDGAPFESKWYGDEMHEKYQDLLHLRGLHLLRLIDIPAGTDGHEHLFHQPAQTRYCHSEGIRFQCRHGTGTTASFLLVVVAGRSGMCGSPFLVWCATD